MKSLIRKMLREQVIDGQDMNPHLEYNDSWKL